MERNDLKEELKKERKLVWNLIHEIDYKNQQLSEMELKYNDTTATLRRLVDGLIAKINFKDSMLMDWELKYNTTLRQLMDENAKLHDEFAEELRQVKSKNTKLKCKLEQQTKEMEECKSQSNLERRTLINEMKMLKEKWNCENLVEVDKTSSAQVAALRKELEEKSEALQDLESHYNCLTVKQILTNQELQDAHKESINLKENLLCQNLVEVDKTSSAQVAALRKELEEKSEALQDLESRYNCLTVKQILTNQELQDARKESINGLKDMLNKRTTLVVKRMGEINQKAFEVACSLKFPNEDWQEISAKLCSSWEQNVQDPKWQPFKRIIFRGNLQEIVDEDDERLKELRNEYGEVAFEAVTTALMEMNEYNASGRYAVPEIWNSKEGRKASMKEIIQYIIKQVKIKKRKRKFT